MQPIKIKNLFDGVKAGLTEELTTILVERTIHGAMKIERIVSPRDYRCRDGFWFDQEEDEFVLVVRGKAGLRFQQKQDEVMELHAGDFVVIAAHEKHRVEWTCSEEETVWLCVFY